MPQKLPTRAEIEARLPDTYKRAVNEKGVEWFSQHYVTTNSYTFDIADFFAVGSGAMLDGVEVVHGSFLANLLPIAEDGGGNYLLLHLDRGSVHLWNHNSEDLPTTADSTALVASSFPSFLGMLKRRRSTTTSHELVASSNSLRRLRAHISEHGIHVPDATGLTITQCCARAGASRLLRECQEQGGALTGCIPLAARSGSKKTLVYLLEQGCDINERFGGETAITSAELMGHGPRFLGFLRERGAR